MHGADPASVAAAAAKRAAESTAGPGAADSTPQRLLRRFDQAANGAPLETKGSMANGSEAPGKMGAVDFQSLEL